MININKLKGVFAENGVTLGEVADILGIAPKTLYEKLKKGVFGSDEIQIMIDEYHIQNPIDIFFTK